MVILIFMTIGYEVLNLDAPKYDIHFFGSEIDALYPLTYHRQRLYQPSSDHNGGLQRAILCTHWAHRLPA